MVLVLVKFDVVRNDVTLMVNFTKIMIRVRFHNVYTVHEVDCKCVHLDDHNTIDDTLC